MNQNLDSHQDPLLTANRRVSGRKETVKKPWDPNTAGYTGHNVSATWHTAGENSRCKAHHAVAVLAQVLCTMTLPVNGDLINCASSNEPMQHRPHPQCGISSGYLPDGLQAGAYTAQPHKCEALSSSHQIVLSN